MKIHPQVWFSSIGTLIGIIMFAYEQTRIISPFIIGFSLAQLSIGMEKTSRAEDKK